MELLIVGLAFCVFLLLSAAQVPVGVALCFAAAVAIAVLDGPAAAATVAGAVPYSATAKYVLLVIPMYVLLGVVIANAGIGMRIYRAVNRFLGRVPGSLPATSVLATALFSGISGSSAADVATFGRVSVSEMAKHGFPRPYAAAVVAAAGAFAVLIPPNVALVVYGVLADESIGALILGAVVPGFVSVIFCVVYVILREVRAVRRTGTRVAAPVMAAVGSSPGASLPGASSAFAEAASMPTSPERASVKGDLLGILYAVVLFLIVVGGLYGGIFTATEAGSIGAAVALLIGLFVKRMPGVSRRSMLGKTLIETSHITSMVFLLIVGGAMFSYLIATSGAAAEITQSIVGSGMPPALVVASILLLLLIAGMFLDGLSLMLISIPIAAPIVTSLGFDGIWFGILAIKVIEIGLITPPVGMNVFIVSGVAKVPAEGVFRALVPFVVLDLIVTILLFAIPSLITWLPTAAGL